MHLHRTILITFMLAVCVSPSAAQSVEYKIKASFIEKFARFTDWGSSVNGEYFEIAVLGQSPFSGELELLAKKVKVKNRPIRITYIDRPQEIRLCQLLFICSSEKNRIPEILDQIGQRNILTIADTPGFCRKGVHINFFIDDSKTMKYEVNPKALHRSNLIVEMQLLNYGEIIN